MYERIRQITFFRVSRVPKQWTGIFKVSNTCMNLCNNMVEEKAGVEKQNSKKGFEKNEHACIVEGVLGFLIFCPSGIVRGQARLGNSKLVKAQTVPKVTSRNPRHTAGAHWHRYWQWHRTGSSWSPIQTLLVAPLTWDSSLTVVVIKLQ